MHNLTGRMFAKISFNSRLFANGLSSGLSGQLHKIFGIRTLHSDIAIKTCLVEMARIFSEMDEVQRERKSVKCAENAIAI